MRRSARPRRHVRDADLAPAAAQLLEEALSSASPLAGAQRAGLHPDRHSALTTNVRRRAGSPRRAPTRAIRTPAIAGPGDVDTLCVSARSALASCRRRARSSAAMRPFIAGQKNASGGPVDRRERGEHPDLGAAGEQQRAGGRLDDARARRRRRASRSRRGSRSAQTPPTSANSANGIAPAARTMPEVGGRPADAEDAEGERDRRDAVAEARERLTHEEECGTPAPRRPGTRGRGAGHVPARHALQHVGVHVEVRVHRR